VPGAATFVSLSSLHFTHTPCAPLFTSLSRALLSLSLSSIMLYALHAINIRDESVLLAYYFSGCGTDADDEWEAAVAAETRPLWPTSPATQPAAQRCVAACVGSRPLVVLPKGEIVFILAGDELEDELGREC
jgi:hypothetical protein